MHQPERTPQRVVSPVFPMSPNRPLPPDGDTARQGCRQGRLRDRFAAPSRLARPLLAGTLLFVFAAFPLSAAAARVVLKGGEVLEGQIVDEVPGRFLAIRIGGTELRIRYDRIESVDRETTKAVEEQLGDRAFGQGLYEEALAHYQEAQRKGGAGPEIEDKIARTRETLDELELAQFSEHIQSVERFMAQGRLDDAERVLTALRDSVDLGSVRKRTRAMLARVYFLRARRAMDVVDYTAAERLLASAIENDPEFAEAHVQLGDLYNNRQLLRPQALQEYRKALALDSKEIPPKEHDRIRWNVARIAHEMENWELALEYYRKVYASNPRYDFRLNDSLSLTFLRRANQLAPNSPEQAVALLREAIVYQPASRDLRYRLAQILIDGDQCEEALQELEVLFALDNQYPNAHYLASGCLRKLGKVLETRSALLAEIRGNPRHTDAWVDLGLLSLDGGAFDDAETYFQRALDLDPGRIPALLGTARVNRRKGSIPIARQYVQVVLDLQPENREANLEMGTILKEERSYREAQRFFDKVITALTREDRTLRDNEIQLLADAFNRRGEIFLISDQPRTARNDFEEALKLEPDYGLTHYNIGQSFLREGTDEANLQRAERSLVKARELDPRNPVFAQGLGIFYQQNMAQRDIPEERKNEYLRRAVRNYRDYLALGGGDVDNVRKWIQESGGSVDQD